MVVVDERTELTSEGWNRFLLVLDVEWVPYELDEYGLRRMLAKVLVQAAKEAQGIFGKGASKTNGRGDALAFLRSEWAADLASFCAVEPGLGRFLAAHGVSVAPGTQFRLL